MADVLITSNQVFFGKSMVNVLCFGNMVDNPTTLQNFADSFRASYATHLSAALSNNWTLENITVSFLGTDTILYSVDVDFTSGVLVGGNNADEIASQSSLLVSTQFQGVAPNRGRIYLAGWTDSSIQAGYWVQSATDAAEDLVNDWVDGLSIGGSNANLRILGRPSPTRANYVSSSITQVIARRSPGVIRSRRLED